MKKPNPKIRGPLTTDEKNEIRRLTQARVSQASISRRLHIGRDTVSMWQVRMGLPTRPIVPETQILRLFRRGWGGYRIARKLKVCRHCVYEVRAKYKIGQRADGSGTGHADADLDGFAAAVRRRADHIRTLAIRHHIGFVRAGRLARQILGTERFRPGCAEPLTSDFPQKHFDKGRISQ